MLSARLRWAEAAKRLSLGALLQLGKGEEGSGGREKASILADTMESIMGAIYLDGRHGAGPPVYLTMPWP